MGCDFPIKAYRSSEKSEAGKLLLTFNPLKSLNSTSPFEIPCNNCMGCRLERSRQWAVRMMHEAKMHPNNCFITLTYDDQNVPTNYSLNLRHWQLFMKKLRKSLPQRLRFFACGEYGDKLGRPHYHALIFNHDFHDKKPHSKSSDQSQLYTSQKLQDLWPAGFATLGSVTYKSAGYVARYCTKKINGAPAADHYFRCSPVDGNHYNVRPEFAVMSRRPGIGSTWFDKFKSDVFPSGFIVVNGQPQAVPRFYLQKLEEEQLLRLQREARKRSLKYKPHNTTERRWAKKAVRDARITNLKRELG